MYFVHVFLCSKTTPKQSQNNLRRHPLFLARHRRSSSTSTLLLWVGRLNMGLEQGGGGLGLQVMMA